VRRELDALKTGALVNLYVSEQQYAYARTAKSGPVVVVINNDVKPAETEFAVAPAGLKNGASLIDVLSVSRDVTVRDGKLRVSLPKRSAALFAVR
jgi:hypothetical protein